MSDKPYKLFAILLDENLGSGYALNAASHMAAQFGTIVPDIRGSSIVDLSGITHFGLPNCGNVILKCSNQELKSRLERARDLSNGEDPATHIVILDFSEEGFTTKNDEELVNEIGHKHDNEIIYRGFLIYGDKNQVRKITKGLELWK